jgi:hypothetical protein
LNKIVGLVSTAFLILVLTISMTSSTTSAIPNDNGWLRNSVGDTMTWNICELIWWTNHYIWYSNFDYTSDPDNIVVNVYSNWEPPYVLEWNDKYNPPSALYRVEQFTTTKATDAVGGWKVIKDVLKIYDAKTGEFLAEYDLNSKDESSKSLTSS